MITLFVCKKVNKQFKAIYQVRIANGVPAKDQRDHPLKTSANFHKFLTPTPPERWQFFSTQIIFKAIYQVRIANGVPAKDQSNNFVRLGQTLFEVMCIFKCSGIQTKYVRDHP